MNIQTKDELLEQLSLAVEQIQKQYIGSDVIKDSAESFFLCNSVDKILHHGLKEGLISWTTEASIWPLLEKITCAKDIEEINMLCLKTDEEKCSAWIQMAVNVNLLGSYISTLQQDTSLLSNHYYEYAFLRDPVLSDTAKSLLNYGIANFDFQITVDRTPKHSNETRKQKAVGNDSCEQTKVKHLPNVEPDGVNKENFSKKQRKKKKPASIHTVVITDLDNNDATSDDINAETTTLVNGESNYPETKQSLGEMMENYDSSDSNDKPLKHFDNGHLSNSLNSKAMIDESVFNNQNSGVYLTLHSEKPSDHEVPLDRVSSLPNMTEYPHCQTNDVEEQTEKRQLSDQANEHKTKIVGFKEIEEYMIAQSLGKETWKSDQNSTLNGEDIHKLIESDSCKTNSSSGIPRTEFSASDFHLDENGKDEESCGVIDVEENLTTAVRNDASTHSMSENLDSRNLKENHETIASKVENFSTLEKSKKNGSPEEDSLSERYSSALDDSGAHDSTEISDERPFNYRVKKVENPEFVSSSYSSTFSDVTDTSYDDRDLNSIPGIHKLASSYKSGSSYDRKSTVDSSVSFDANGLPVFDTLHYTESSSRPSSIDDSSGRFADLASEWDMYEDLLNVEEEHFSGPDNFGGLSTSEELEIAIEHYKKMIKVKQDKSDRDELVQKLIKLRLRLQQEKDGPPAVNPKFRKILGHYFSKEEDTSGGKYSCDQCGKVIWIIWQSLFTCKDCDYHSHRKCLEHIERPCPNRNLSSLSYILDICPDTGLDAQQYRCAECRKAIALSKDGVGEARSCDYTGQYFCDQCHWNDQVCIPARVLHNWDFVQYKVCRQTKQLLDLMKTRPLLNLQKINPMLFRYVEELREVGKLRQDILIMKKYFLTCRDALESKLLMQLQKRQHFVDSPDIYSLQDLLDLNNDVLLPEISKIHALFLAHIKADCELCRARGFICEVCQDSSDVIFAFDPHVIKCTKCSAVYHKICFKPDECPKCHRKRKVVERL